MTEFFDVPCAKRVPKERVFHGDVFVDDYEWLRDKESQDVQDYVVAQNRYCEQRMRPLKTLRDTLFEEFKSHVQETDMSVPTRMDGYWYFTRTKQGEQYAVQCRLPIAGPDDWDPPTVEPGVPLEGEQVVFDTNIEAKGHDFFRVGGMDISKDGCWMLYGVDTKGDERYDFRIRNIATGEELPEHFDGIGGACFTADAKWVFYALLDEAWRPYAVMRHKVGTPVEQDVEVYREEDERFWVGVGLSFDERNIVIGTGSKTTTEVLLLSCENPEGEFHAFIPRETDVEYDVSFACFEGAGEDGGDIPLAVVYHNALNPNFEIDVIDMRSHEPPYRLGEGVLVAVGSPYGCEHGDDVEPGASARPIGTPYSNPCNPAILQGAHGLGIEGISIHRHFVTLQYRAESLTHIAVMTKQAASEDFLAGRPWRFTELVPHALEDDWDVDESVDEINEERAAVWAAVDGVPVAVDDTAGPHARDLHGGSDDGSGRNMLLAAAQGEGSAVHGVSRKAMTSSDGATADEMPGRPVAYIRSAPVEILPMTRLACVTPSPAIPDRASCMTSIRPRERTVCSNARRCSAISIRAITWNVVCGSPHVTASAFPFPWCGDGMCLPVIPRCSLPVMARMRLVPILGSPFRGSACLTVACCMRFLIFVAAVRWVVRGMSRGICLTRSIRLRILWMRRVRCSVRGWRLPRGPWPMVVRLVVF